MGGLNLPALARRIEQAADIYVDALILLLFSLILTMLTLGLVALIIYGLVAGVEHLT